MIELAQHIESLLLENDCVIVPGLGGFITYYTPAARNTEERIFLPPNRVIGFNPQLKINDGMLAQSYMTVYDTNFSDATRMIEKEVEKFFEILHAEGQVDFANVGELRYSIHGTYTFTPYDNKITTPYLYGLDSFEMKELSALTHLTKEKSIPLTPIPTEEKKHKFEIKINRSYITRAVAMIAIVVSFFLLSTPIRNTDVVEGNYAQLLPGELWETIEKQSLIFSQIDLCPKAEKAKDKIQSKPIQSPKTVGISHAAETDNKQAEGNSVTLATKTKNTTEVAHPVATSQAIAPNQQVSPSKPYHIIIASVGTAKDAEAMARQLNEKGFAEAKAIIGDGKMRVSIQSCNTEAEAYQTLNSVRKNEAYQTAWVLKK